MISKIEYIYPSNVSVVFRVNGSFINLGDNTLHLLETIWLYQEVQDCLGNVR